METALRQLSTNQNSEQVDFYLLCELGMKMSISEVVKIAKQIRRLKKCQPLADLTPQSIYLCGPQNFNLNPDINRQNRHASHARTSAESKPHPSTLRQPEDSYLATVFSSPRYFSIGSIFGSLPSHAAYIFARSSVFPRDSTIARKRSPFARVNPP